MKNLGQTNNINSTQIPERRGGGESVENGAQDTQRTVEGQAEQMMQEVWRLYANTQTLLTLTAVLAHSDEKAAMLLLSE